jgi:subtilase family serine protease
VTVTTTSPDGLSAGSSVTIAEAGIAAYDGGYKVASIVNPTTFTATSTAKTPPTGLANSTGGTINNLVSTLETTLDVEWAHAIAPAANIVLIELTNGL